MKTTIKVRPQEEDSTHVCTLCPVAQALREAVGLPRALAPHEGKKIYTNLSRHYAMAQPSRLWATGPKGTIKVDDVPANVVQWIKNWDATGGEGDPFDFEVEMSPKQPVHNIGEHINWLFPGVQWPGANRGG